MTEGGKIFEDYPSISPPLPILPAILQENQGVDRKVFDLKYVMKLPHSQVMKEGHESIL